MQLSVEAQRKAQGASILLVEDDPTDAELFVEALRTHGFDNRVVVARDGARALEHLFGAGEDPGRDTAEMPSLVVMDLQMPRVDGLEALRRIRADQRTRWLPVVMFSGFGVADGVVKAYRLGANACVVKASAARSYFEAVRCMAYFWLCVNEVPPVDAEDRPEDRGAFPWLAALN